EKILLWIRVGTADEERQAFALPSPEAPILWASTTSYFQSDIVSAGAAAPTLANPSWSAVERFAECASQLVPRIGLPKHFDFSHSIARCERHLAVPGGQQYLELGLRRTHPLRQIIAC